MSILNEFFTAPVPAGGAVKKTIPLVEVKQHARLGASGAHRWTICHVSPRLEDGKPDNAKDAARIGTICHDLGEQCLKVGDDVMLSFALGKNALVDKKGLVVYRAPGTYPDGGHEVTDKMVGWAGSYIDFIRKLVMGGGKLRVEARLSIEHITDEPDAMGTSDSVILFPEEICIADLKCGFKRVPAKKRLEGIDLERAPERFKIAAGFSEVLKPNVQLVMYAEAAIEEMRKDDPAAFAKIKRVRYIVVQPPLDFVDEHVVSLEDHADWVQWIREQAAMTRSPFAHAYPGAEQCQYCKAYPCPEAESAALMAAFDSFEALDAERLRRPSVDELPKIKKLLPMLRDYCDYIDGRIYGELSAGRPVAGYKLVAGEQGDRKWVSEVVVRDTLLEQGVAEGDIYTPRKVKSPAQIEEMTRGSTRKVSKAVFEELKANITRAQPSGSKVVEAGDARPAVSFNITAGFEFDNEPKPAFDFNKFFNT